MEFYVQNHDTMREAVVKGSANRDRLVFFNVQRHCTAHGPLPFPLHRNATAAAGIDPGTFGSAAEHLVALIYREAEKT